MDSRVHELDKIAISVKSHMLLKQLLNENPVLEEIMRNAKNSTEALIGVRNWVLGKIKQPLRLLPDSRCGNRGNEPDSQRSARLN